MTMISDDRFPDTPMTTQGVNNWHDESLGAETPALDQIQHGQAVLTIGQDQGFEWHRARPSGNGTFHKPSTPAPPATIVRQA